MTRLRHVGAATRMKRSECPQCSRVVDAASPMNCNATPAPGDITFCVGCGAMCQFTDDLGLAPVDVATLPAETRTLIEDAQRKLAMVKPS